jgi:hypothetical protein
MKKGNNFMIGLIPIKKFAEEMNKPLSTIKTWRRRGELPEYLFKKVGTEVFVRTERIKEWVESDS